MWKIIAWSKTAFDGNLCGRAGRRGNVRGLYRRGFGKKNSGLIQAGQRKYPDMTDRVESVASQKARNLAGWKRYRVVFRGA